MSVYKAIVGWINNPNPVSANGVPLVNGDIIEDTNICQPIARALFSNLNYLTFKNCNLTNVRLPSNHLAIDCLRIEKSYCTNLHPELIDLGVPACSVNCAHVKEVIEAVVVDGDTVVPSENVYSDKITKRILSDGTVLSDIVWTD